MDGSAPTSLAALSDSRTPDQSDGTGDAPPDERSSPQARDWERLSSAPTEALPSLWLELLARTLPDCQAAALHLGPVDEGPFTLQALWPSSEAASHAARQLVASALQSRNRAILLPPLPPTPPVAGSERSPAGAALAEPLILEDRLHGAVAIEFDVPRDASGERAAERMGALIQLAWGWLAGRVRQWEGERSETRVARIERVLHLASRVGEATSFRDAATAFATELADALQADLAAVGFLDGRRLRLEALSNSARFGKRTNLIRSIELAMSESIDARSALAVPAGSFERSSNHDPRPGGHAHTALARDSGSPHVCTIPIFFDDEPSGAITVERQAPFEPSDLAFLDAACGLVGPQLRLARLDDRFIGRKALDSLKTMLARAFGPNHVAFKLTSLGVIALFLFMVFARGEFRVTADATLEPMVLRAAAAPMDGYIAQSTRRAGDLVEEGDLLGALDDRDLILESLRWKSTFAQADKKYRQSVAARDAAESAIQAAAKQEALAELERISRLLERVEFRAPFAGVVVTGDLSQRLGSPVERGEVLFEVAPLNEYRVAMRVDEDDVAHIQRGQSGSLILSSLPDHEFSIEVDKVTPVAEASDGRNTFRVEARLNAKALARMRPGVEGIAKVVAGERSLFWIWTREAITWVRLQLWSWLP